MKNIQKIIIAAVLTAFASTSYAECVGRQHKLNVGLGGGTTILDSSVTTGSTTRSTTSLDALGGGRLSGEHCLVRLRSSDLYITWSLGTNTFESTSVTVGGTTTNVARTDVLFGLGVSFEWD